MTTTTDTASPEFNFDAFMYGVRRAAPFDGSTLADSIADDEVRSIEAAFVFLLKRAEAAEARVKELEQQKPCAAISKIKHWREAPCNGVDWAKGWKEGWNACIKKIEAAGGFVKKDGAQ